MNKPAYHSLDCRHQSKSLGLREMEDEGPSGGGVITTARSVYDTSVIHLVRDVQDTLDLDFDDYGDLLPFLSVFLSECAEDILY